VKQENLCVSAVRRDGADKSFTNIAKRGQNRRIDTRVGVGASGISKRHLPAVPEAQLVQAGEKLIVVDIFQIQHRLNWRAGGLRGQEGMIDGWLS
jgi:hypothetical protein